MWSVSGTLRGFTMTTTKRRHLDPTNEAVSVLSFPPNLSLTCHCNKPSWGCVTFTVCIIIKIGKLLAKIRLIRAINSIYGWITRSPNAGRQECRIRLLWTGAGIDYPNTSVPTRTEGNNIRNTGTLTLNTIWTRLFSTQLGYQNSLYDYQNSGGNYFNPSLAGLLNRIEQSVWLNLQWQVRPETVVLIGGNLGW